MTFGSPNMIYRARKICFFDITILVGVTFALIVVVSVFKIITTNPQMGAATFEFGLQVLFAGLE